MAVINPNVLAQLRIAARRMRQAAATDDSLRLELDDKIACLTALRDRLQDMIETIEHLIAEGPRFRMALEWYAADINWIAGEGGTIPAIADSGVIARRALAGQPSGRS